MLAFMGNKIHLIWLYNDDRSRTSGDWLVRSVTAADEIYSSHSAHVQFNSKFNFFNFFGCFCCKSALSEKKDSIRLHAVIQYLHCPKGLSPKEVHEEMVATLGDCGLLWPLPQGEGRTQWSPFWQWWWHPCCCGSLFEGPTFTKKGTRMLNDCWIKCVIVERNYVEK